MKNIKQLRYLFLFYFRPLCKSQIFIQDYVSCCCCCRRDLNSNDEKNDIGFHKISLLIDFTDDCHGL